MSDLTFLEQRLNYYFNNKDLLLEAITHKSFSHENNLAYNYERLEFLGDSIINLLLTDILFKLYPKTEEGPLSSLRSFLISKDFLYHIVSTLKLYDFVRIGKNELLRGYNYNTSLLCDVLEAIIGAIYLDAGLEQVKSTFEHMFLEKLDYFSTNIDKVDSKSLLQKYISKKYKKMPQYILVETEGPSHNKTFVVEVRLPNNISAKGVGKKKKTAEKAAASLVLEKLGY